MRAIDFFCGAGGLTKGLLASGIEVMCGIDVDSKCQETYENNNHPSFFCNKNIKDIGKKELIELTDQTNFDGYLFAGCAPCQPFSKQRKSFNRHQDFDLLNEFVRIIDEVKPGYVFVENVPGLMKTKETGPLNNFLYKLIELKYKFIYDIIDAKDYGVPQTRKRFILLASRYFQPEIPQKKYGINLKPFLTVRDAISNLPPLEQGQKSLKIPNHNARSLSLLNIKRLQNTPKDGGSRISWPKALWLECHKKNVQYSDVYGRMKWNEPSPTLTARCTSISNGRYGHPEQNRAISLREAAYLQSFPRKYKFYGSDLHIAKQIGNAVPVQLAKEIGKYFCKMEKTAL